MKQNTRFLVYWQAFFGVRFNIDITKCCMVSWGYGLKQPHRYGRRSEEEQRQFKVEAGPPGHASVCLWFTLLVYELFMNCLCCFWIVFRKTEYLHYMPSISPYNPDLEVFHISKHGIVTSLPIITPMPFLIFHFTEHITVSYHILSYHVYNFAPCSHYPQSTSMTPFSDQISVDSCPRNAQLLRCGFTTNQAFFS